MTKNVKYISFLEKLENDRKKERLFTDVIIKFNDSAYHSHRFLLGTTSRYFEKLLTGQFKDKFQNEIVLCVPYGHSSSGGSIRIDSIPVQLVFDFIYTGDIDLTNENVFSVLFIEEYLEIPKLRTACVKYIADSLTAETWMNAFLVSKQLSLGSLERVCKDKYLENYCGLDLSKIRYDDFFEILNHMESSGAREQEKLKAIMTWVKFDKNKRDCHLERLTQTVNFAHISSRYMDRYLDDEVFVRKHETVVNRVLEAMEARKILICGTNFANTIYTLSFDPKTRKIVRQHTLRGAFHCAGAFVYRSEVLIVTRQKYKIYLFIYNTEKDGDWSGKIELTTSPKYLPSAALSGGKLYLTGGYRLWTPLSRRDKNVTDVDVFDLEGRMNSPLSPLEEPNVSLINGRHGHVCVARLNEIYILGGYSRQGSERRCEVINTDTGHVKSIASMHESRSEFSAVAFRNSIIAIGGWNSMTYGHRSVESYSIADDCWSIMPSMVVPRFYHCSCVFDDRIYVIGGHRANSIEHYDPESLKWIQDQPVVLKRCHFAVMTC